MILSNTFPKVLLGLYIILFLILAIEPYDRAVWFVENLPVWIAIFILVVWYRKFQFSNQAYFWMWLFLCYHTIGGHWTFARVPFEYGNELLALLQMDFLFPEGRNNFDRVGHFLVGVFAYAVVEYLLREKFVTNKTVAFLFAVFALGFWAAFYEVIEMYFAVLEGGDAGAAFLGSQGDEWDAQKDMLMDICGAILFASLALLNAKKFIKL